MSLSNASIAALAEHWAVKSLGAEALARSEQLVNERLAQGAVGKQIAFSLSGAPEDDALLERAALAYEMAAIEGLEELGRSSGSNGALRTQAISASYKAYDIRRLMPVPADTDGRLFFVLQLASLACCGGRWSDLRRWCEVNAESLAVPSVADVPWDRRLLYRLFDCWARLFRKKRRDDLERICEIVASLRADQEEYEAQYLGNEPSAANRAMALRLVAFYHWAKGTDVLARYILQGEPANPFGGIEKHFDAALKGAAAAGDVQHEIILRWLYASARVMVTHSRWWPAC